MERQTLDWRIYSLRGEVDPVLRVELERALQSLRKADNPLAVVLSFSRMSLRLLTLAYAAIGHRKPNDNLYECIMRAANGDGQKIVGLYFLPDEMAAYLHALRVMSNKVDHGAEQISMGYVDAENGLLLLLRVIEWFYCEFVEGPSLTTLYEPDAFAHKSIDQLHPLAAGGESSGEIANTRLPVVGLRFLDVNMGFKNRIEILARIQTYLQDQTVKLVTIIGRGGMGKTALLCKICDEIERGHFILTNNKTSIMGADGIIYISFRGVDRPGVERLHHDLSSMVGPTARNMLQQVLRDNSRSLQEKSRYLLGRLRSGIFLLVLDNLEDALDEENRIKDIELRSFLDLCLTTVHGVRILVTSRRPLIVASAASRATRTVHLNDGIPIADAVLLLRELDPEESLGLRSVDSDLLTQVAELCHGVPRALESIAGILVSDSLLTVDELLADRTLFTDHVVENLIEERIRRVTPEQRYILEALSIYGRPVPLAAVDYLLAPFGVPDVSKNIRDLVREYSVTYQRIEKVFHLHPLDQYHIYRHLDEDGEGFTKKSGHLRAATYWREQNSPKSTWNEYDDLFPKLQEFEHWLLAGEAEKSCYVVDEIDSNFLSNWGYASLVIAMRTRLANLLSDKLLSRSNFLKLGRAYWKTGQSEKALDWAHRSLDDCKILNMDLHYLALNLCGIANATLGKFDDALARYRQALSVVKGKSITYEANLLGNIGNICFDIGDIHGAVNYFTQSIELLDEEAESERWSYRIGNKGAALIELGDIEEGLKLAKKALEIARKQKHSRDMVRHLGTCGLGHVRLGDFKKATKLYEEGVVLARHASDLRGEAHHLGELALVSFLEGKSDHALEQCQASLEAVKRSGNMPRESRLLCLQGRIHMWEGLLAEAADSIQQGARLAQKIGANHTLCYALTLSGYLHLCNGEIRRAEKFFSQAINLPGNGWKTRALLLNGAVSLIEGDPEVARNLFAKAESLCSELIQKCSRNHRARCLRAVALAGLERIGDCYGDFSQAAECEALGCISEVRKYFTLCTTHLVKSESLTSVISLLMREL